MDGSLFASEIDAHPVYRIAPHLGGLGEEAAHLGDFHRERSDGADYNSL